MKANKRLKKYFLRINGRLRRRLGRFDEKFTGKELHELRVNIKKIKALFELVSHCRPAFEYEYFFRPYKLIFKKAGKIRECAIGEKLIKKYSCGGLGKLLKKLHLSKQKGEREFTKILKKNPGLKLANKEKGIAEYIEQVDNKKVNGYLKKKQKELDKIGKQKKIKSLKAHLFRKKLKMMSYNKKSLQFSNKDRNRERDEETLQTLGEWHDLRVVQRYLKHNTENNNSAQNEELKRMNKKFKNEQKRLLKRVGKVFLLH